MKYRNLVVLPVMMIILVGCLSVPEQNKAQDNVTNKTAPNPDSNSMLDSYNEGMHSFNTAAQECFFRR